VRAAHQIEPLRIVLAPIQETLQSIAGIGELAGGDVGRANLSPDFVLRVNLIALDHFFKVSDGLRQAVLGAGDAAQLIVRIDFFRINVDSALKSFAGLIQFSPILMNQTEIVMRRRVAWIDGRGFEILFESGARALRADDAHKVTAQQEEQEEQQER
jgi:hypothetical protein